MPAYVFVDVEVTDPDTYQSYATQVPPLVKQYGGKYLVRGGNPEKVEGDRQPSRVVILAFDDKAAAKRFYNSAEYQQIIGLRHRAATSSMILLEGYTEPVAEPAV